MRGPRAALPQVTLDAGAVLGAGHHAGVLVLRGEWQLRPGLLRPASASQEGGKASYLAGLMGWDPQRVRAWRLRCTAHGKPGDC